MPRQAPKYSELSILLLPFLVLGGAILALIEPLWISWLRGSAISFLLGLVMLFMGLTLQEEDLKRLKFMPQPIVLGVILQYTVMPLLGYVLAEILPLNNHLKAGLILVASCPGGTASNVMTYLARGEVALSVSMTTFSTLLANLLTPAFASFLIGHKVQLNRSGLFLDTLLVVLVPLSLGYLLKRRFSRITEKLLPIFPALSVVFITLIVSSIIGQSRELVLQVGWPSLVAVLLLHSFGFALGYLLSWLFGQNTIENRTISLEVGMQNSGLGVVLALNNLPSPLSALPPTLSSVTHSLIAGLLAAVWRIKKVPSR
ncbi:MAG: bile acid:sodium symporter family protein [Leptospiraceae bacterium]|nr:bile acid:sodium symporter family protein [Leptospiraceae bacterium]